MRRFVLDWYDERPRRRPAEYADELARKLKLERSERTLVETDETVEEAAHYLKLEPELAHALVLVLQGLPRTQRRGAAEDFFILRAERTDLPRRPPALQAAAAAAALRVVELTRRPDLANELLTDLLQGAAQLDDPSLTPLERLNELRKSVARTRLDLELERDALSPHAAATIAVTELLDPSSDVVDLHEVLMRSTWAVLGSRGPNRALEFLLQVDREIARIVSYDEPTP